MKRSIYTIGLAISCSLFWIQNISAQSVPFYAFKLVQESTVNNQWVAPYKAFDYLFFPDDEERGDLNDGRYVILLNDKVEAYGFYQSNATSLILQDFKSDGASIYVIRLQSQDSLTLYNYDIKEKSEKTIILKKEEFDQQKGQSYYIDLLFDLNEEDLQSNFKQGIESLGIGFFYAPGEYHRFIKFYSGGSGRRQSGLDPGIQDSISKVEISTRSFSYGISFTTKIGPAMAFESGFVFNRMGFQTNKISLSDSRQGQIDYTFNYLDVPLVFRVYPINRTIRWYIKFGLIPQFYRNNEITQMIQDENGTTLDEDINSYTNGQFVNLNMAGTIGTGLELVVGSSGVLYVQPSYQSMLKAFASQSYVKRYLNQKSIAAGFKLTF